MTDTRKTSEQYLTEEIEQESQALARRLRRSVFLGVTTGVILLFLLGIVSIMDVAVSPNEPFSVESIEFYQ